MNKPSKAYFDALRRTQNHHAAQNKTFSGQFAWKLRYKIKDIIDRTQAKTLLDYGCGKGKQYNPAFNTEDGKTLEQFWGVDIFKYDPGVPKFSAEPAGKFDVVICVQVLNTIPTSDLPWVIERLYSFANRAVFVAERIKDPKKRIYADMEDQMPRGVSRAQWIEMLRRPGSPVELVTACHDADPEQPEKVRWLVERAQGQG